MIRFGNLGVTGTHDQSGIGGTVEIKMSTGVGSSGNGKR